MERLVVIKDVTQLVELISYINSNDYIAYDVETTGVGQEAKIIGFSLSAHTKLGYYVALSYWDKEQQTMVSLNTSDKAEELIRLLTKKSLIMHNAVFDCQKTKQNFKIDLMPALHTDTMILAHLLDENRSAGLKDLGVMIFGDNAKLEQQQMKDSALANGATLTKDNYEMYKADVDLLGKYGAKDAVLTIKLFYHLTEELYAQGLDKFFYDEESMPLLKGPTYDLNSTGLKVNPDKLSALKGQLESDAMRIKAFIYKEIEPFIKDEYPGTNKRNTFNIGSSKQLAWLLFVKLDNEFNTLTAAGKEVCKFLKLKLPYSPKAKREFIKECLDNKGVAYAPPAGKAKKPKTIADVSHYLAADKLSLQTYASKYKWVEQLLEYNKILKLLNTYVVGIQERMQYGLIHPSFLQHGTTSGRYSSRNPNFQNLPRDDKRVKSCIVSRPGKVFIGADYSQLEPRVFASFSKDERLLASFKNKDDFYSVIGAAVFNKYDCSLKKDDPNSFANKYPKLRNIAKVIGLSTTYGTTAPKMALAIGKTRQEAQQVIDDYFDKFPKVLKFMLESHEQAKAQGYVENLFGRKRRMPEAKEINKIYGITSHDELPYEARNILNLSVNHRVQSTGASIINRAAIAFWQYCKDLALGDPRWNEVKIVLQVHDELVIEGPEALGEDISIVLKEAMENTVILPGVDLVAEPKIAHNLSDLK